MTTDEYKELMQLRSTEAHVIQLLEYEDDEQTRELLMAKYRRTQARRMTLEIQENAS